MSAQRRDESRLRMVFCDDEGRVYDHPELAMAGASGPRWLPVPWKETIPLPQGSAIVAMPGRLAVGYEPRRESFVCLGEVEGSGPVAPAAAVLPPAYLRTLLPAQERPADAPPLPLLGYTAVGWARDGFRAAALRLDPSDRWDPRHFDTGDLPRRIEARQATLAGNRIVDQLAHCALDYHCYTAQNFFYQRWEAGVPTTPRCNARCAGCISLQDGPCPSPQERLDFEPSGDEIAAVVGHHLAEAEEPMVSFGQGCEGEPLLRAEAIAQALRQAGARTGHGTVNVNTNASRPDALALLADAGLDSVRITLASADPTRYDAYHRPDGYNICQVGQSFRLARERGLRVAANILVLPGATDTHEETRCLVECLQRHRVDMVQLRNLSLDPDEALAALRPAGPGRGVRRLLARLRRKLSGVPIGSFNRPVDRRGSAR